MSFLSSKYGDIRVTSKDTRFRSVAEARDSLINKCDGQSVLLHSIAVRIFNGEILTISEIKGILRFPSSASDEEVINSITDDLPVYAYKEPGFTDYLVLPIDVSELLHVICLQRKLASSSNVTPKVKRGSYSCSICGKLGHTKAKCPMRFHPHPQSHLSHMAGSSQHQFNAPMNMQPGYSNTPIDPCDPHGQSQYQQLFYSNPNF
ncbi:hypothetical protein GEMRC1_001811 [Eukaryota sp. GEM-RC1]